MTMDLIPKQDAKIDTLTTRAWCGVWRYCETIAPDITSKVKRGYSNNGDGLDADDARALGLRLRATIIDGSARRWYAGEVAAGEDWIFQQFETLGDVAEFFVACGGFEIW
jgi:hypothetical protein